LSDELLRVGTPRAIEDEADMKALILGSVGALCDTSDLWVSACRAALRDNGDPHRLPRDRHRDGGALSFEAVRRSRDAHFGDALARERLMPRARLFETLAAAERHGIALALVTTTPPDWATTVLRRLGLPPDRFDAIVTRDHVVAPKPAPDCYHLAAALLATAPEDCLALEDGRAGAEAARGAGMATLDLSVLADSMGQVLAALPREPVAAI
jgi:HAD superfamily hydrolase (TIGR01509 family)